MIDNTTIDTFPKTLVIRNEHGGMIWQIYHVETQRDVDNISEGANNNGFYGVSLENHMPEEEETFPTWRNECSWRQNVKHD